MPRPKDIREDVWRALRFSRMWSGGSDQDVAYLARSSILVEYKRGQKIFCEGEMGDSLLVILEGHARAVHFSENRQVVAQTMWPGDVVGAMSALGDVPFETDVECVEPMLAISVPVSAVREIIAHDPTVAMSVIAEISRLWSIAVSASKVNSADVVGRVAGYLAGLTRTHLGGSAYAVTIPVTRVELAASLSTTPESLSRAFRQLEEEELIESHDRMIIVPDGEALLTKHDGERVRAAVGS